MRILFSWAAIIASFAIPVQSDTFGECTRATDWFNHGECIDVKYGILEKAIAQISQEVRNMQRVLETLRATKLDDVPGHIQEKVENANSENARALRSTRFRTRTTPGGDATAPSACVCTTTDSALPTTGSDLKVTPVVLDNIFEEPVMSYNNRDVLVVSLPEVVSAAGNETSGIPEPVKLQVKDNLQPFELAELERAAEPTKQNESSSESPQEPAIPPAERSRETAVSEPAVLSNSEGMEFQSNQNEMVRRLEDMEKNNAAKFEDFEKQLQVLREELSTAIKVVMADNEEKKKMFFDGAKQGKVTPVRTLLTAGFKAQETDATDKGRTALHKAAKEGHKEVAKMLIAANASVNARDFNSWTPLHFAVSQGHADLVQLLLDAGASSLARVDDRSTPLHLAAQRGSKEVIEVLLKTNVSVHAKDINGNTPLHLAALNNHSEVADFLVKAGASKLIKNNLHETPKEVALSKGFTKLAEIL